MSFTQAASAALTRAFRTLLQTLLGVVSAFVLWLGTQSAFDIAAIKVEGPKFVLGLVIAGMAFVASWLQNTLELWKAIDRFRGA